MRHVERFSTEGMSVAARVDYWNGLATQTFTALAIDPADRADFHGELGRAVLGDFGLAVATSSSATVRRVPRSYEASEPDRFFFVHLQLRGASLCVQDGREALVEGGGFAICDSARPYRLSLSDDNEMLVLKIPAVQMLDRVRAAEAKTAVRMAGDPRSGLLTPFLRGAWTSVAAGGSDPVWCSAVCETSLELLDLALSDPEGDDGGRARLRRRACELIDAALCEPDLNPASVAQTLGVSPRYLQMAFAEAGLTASDYIRTRRLDLAKRRLADGDPPRTVTEVAYDLGFGDLTYFSRAFRRRFGVTPSHYRSLRRSQPPPAVGEEDPPR